MKSNWNIEKVKIEFKFKIKVVFIFWLNKKNKNI